MGVVELLPTNYNNLLVSILILQRWIHGYAVFPSCKITVECCRAWFPDHFDLTVGLEVAACYVGGALVNFMSGYIYEVRGYQVPYYSFGFICLVFWVYNLIFMPKTSNPVVVKPKAQSTTVVIEPPWPDVNQLSGDEVPARTEEVIPPLGLSWFVVVPLVAMSLILVLLRCYNYSLLERDL